MSDTEKRSKAADGGLRLTTCSSSLPDAVQILIYDERLTHSYWCDFQHRCRTWNGLMNTIRHEIKRGRCTAYRFITIHRTGYGIPPKNAGGMARELAAQDSDNSNDING